MEKSGHKAIVIGAKGELLKAVGREAREDMQKSLNGIVQTAFARLDLVTREQFDAQLETLEQTRAQMTRLEQEIEQLKNQLAELERAIE